MTDEHWPGCWRMHLSCAIATVGYEAARANAAIQAAELDKETYDAIIRGNCDDIMVIEDERDRARARLATAATLVAELTTLLYETLKTWQLSDGRHCQIVQCGACHRKGDTPEAVVHDRDCPVFRLRTALEAS